MESPEGTDRGAARATLWERLRSGTGVRIEILLLAVAAIIALALSPELRSLERTGLVELGELGERAPLVLLQGYGIVAVTFLPAFPLDLAAGAHFGFLEGVFWIQLCATAASVLGYLLGRFALRGFVDRLLVRKPKLARIQAAVEREGWRIVFLTRLSPVFSFSLLNVFYGAGRVPLVPYALATFAGILPGTALYVYAGEMAGDLSGAPGQPRLSGAGWVLEGLGLVLTAAVVVHVTRRASRILAASTDEESGSVEAPAEHSTA